MIGRRTAGQGYGPPDGVRQKFTGYERDRETALDYAQARYYAYGPGRFTAVDPLAASGVAANPQTWNRYAYAVNNPARFTDPTGMLTQTNKPADGGQQRQPPPQQPQGQVPVRVEIKKGEITPVRNQELGNGKYFTGIRSMLTITLYDKDGKQINNFTAKETVIPVEGDPVIQREGVATVDNGQLPDIVGVGLEHDEPVSPSEATEIAIANIEKKHRSVTEMTMEVSVPGGGAATVVFRRTFTNVDQNNNLRNFRNPETGRRIINYTLDLSPAIVTTRK